MKRILVIRGGAIGDFVLTLPAIKLLRESYPQAHLEILGYKHIIALAENRSYANAVRSIEYAALASFFARNAALPDELCDYFKGFDLVVSYLFDPDRIFETNLDRAGANLFLACPPKAMGNEHAARQLARPLEQLDLILEDHAARIFPAAEDRAAALLLLQNQPVIAIHPGSGSPSKNWPVQNWAELSHWILERDSAASFLLIGGEADENEISHLSRSLPADRVRRIDRRPLPELAAILECCWLFLGHDSGISHIAAAVGTRSLLLFGPTDPATWAPANRNARVLRSPNEQLTGLSVEEVKAAVRESYELIRIGIRT